MATRIFKHYYTSCDDCGAINDQSDTLAEARSNERYHSLLHKTHAPADVMLHMAGLCDCRSRKRKETLSTSL